MQKLDGTAPTKLLEDRSTFVSLGSEPKDAGIVPVRLLEDRLISVSKSAPIKAGIVPWRRGDSIIVSAMLER